MYVTLSRVTSIEGLHLFQKKNDRKFYHGRNPTVSAIELRAEFQRLSLNRLETVEKLIYDFINTRKRLSLYTFNCQSLRAHAQDLQLDRIASSSNFLILSETWMNDDNMVDIPNFEIVVKYKRPGTRAGGVAIYHNSNDGFRVVTPQMELNTQQLESLSVQLSKVGEICPCQTELDNSISILIVAVYISPNQPINTIIEFIRENLIKYTPEVSQIPNKDYDKIPMILNGDFNVNFASDAILERFR